MGHSGHMMVVSRVFAMFSAAGNLFRDRCGLNNGGGELVSFIMLVVHTLFSEIRWLAAWLRELQFEQGFGSNE